MISSMTHQHLCTSGTLSPHGGKVDLFTRNVRISASDREGRVSHAMKRTLKELFPELEASNTIEMATIDSSEESLFNSEYSL